MNLPIIGRFINQTDELKRYNQITKMVGKCKRKFLIKSVQSFSIVAIPMFVIDEVFPTLFEIRQLPPVLWINIVIINILLLDFALTVHRISAAKSGVLKP